MTVPIKQNVAGQFDYVQLYDGADLLLNPTIAAADFRISVDDAAEGALAVLPVVTPAASGWVKFAFSQAETNGSVIKVRWVDAAGAEWNSGGATWRTSTVVLSDLPTSAAAASASASAGEILIVRGDSMDQDITGLGDITTRAGGKRVWFTVKAQLDDADADSIIMITEVEGLVVLNGVDTTVAPIRTAEGSITVTDAGTGALTIWINPTATDELAPNSKLHYDIQWTDATDVLTPALGKCRVRADATRAVV